MVSADKMPEGVRPHICFVALSSFNLLATGDEVKHIGGAEVQQLAMANWLLANNYRVTFITYDHGQGEVELPNGLAVSPAFEKDSGVRIIRFVHPRWTGLWSAMRRVNADIYYQRGAGTETGQVALWCKLHKKRFLFAAANDRDFHADFRYLPKARERLLFLVGLKIADPVICQTANQRRILRDNFAIKSAVISNSGRANSAKRRTSVPEKRVLWVGRFVPQKRLEFLLEVARSCPEFQFDVVGDGNISDAYVTRLQDEASSIPNVVLHGYIPYEKVMNYYDRTMIVCNTSTHEGFPNVYVEAWSAGIPVLATFDPDEVIKTSKAGWVRSTIDEFVDVLQQISRNSRMWQDASRRASDRYDYAHRLDANMPLFERLIGDYS